jgi:LysM domain
VIEDPTEQSADGPSACPFVAFEDDRDHRSSKADYRHRCFAAPEPEPRAFPHQERYCLSEDFARCPIFLDWARQEAAAVKVPSAANRPNDITDDVAAAVATDEPIAPAFLAARSSTPAANLSLPRRTPEANASLWSYDGEGKRTKTAPAPTPPSSLGAPAVAMARRGPSHPGWENPPRLESFPRLRSREEHRANQPLLLAAIGVAIVMAALILFPIIMTAKGGTAAAPSFSQGPTNAVQATPGGSPSASVAPNNNSFYPYKIKSGDQLWAIAKYFNIQLDDLLAANPWVKDPSSIAAGQVLSIPPIGWHATPSPVPGH